MVYPRPKNCQMGHGFTENPTVAAEPAMDNPFCAQIQSPRDIEGLRIGFVRVVRAKYPLPYCSTCSNNGGRRRTRENLPFRLAVGSQACKTSVLEFPCRARRKDTQAASAHSRAPRKPT